MRAGASMEMRESMERERGKRRGKTHERRERANDRHNRKPLQERIEACNISANMMQMYGAFPFRWIVYWNALIKDKTTCYGILTRICTGYFSIC